MFEAYHYKMLKRIDGIILAKLQNKRLINLMPSFKSNFLFFVFLNIYYIEDDNNIKI